MQHSAARKALDAIVAGEGFGIRAVTLVQAAHLPSLPLLPEGLAQRVLDAAIALPPDRPEVSVAELPGQRVPDSLEEAGQLLAPLIVDYPAQVGLQLDALATLLALWPHANRRERLELRRRWFVGVAGRAAPQGSAVSRLQLRTWQRSLPTVHDDETPAPVALADMLEEEDPERAYHMLAVHLGPGTDLATLSWILGVLAQQVLLHRFDRHGSIQQALLGTVAAERLCPYVAPETMVTLLSQLAHQIWWCRHSGGKELEPGCPDSGLALAEAVRRGDYTAAQRAARQAAVDRDAFWRSCYQLLGDALRAEQPCWTRALAGITVAAQRAGGGPISPDDAAALGATLASVAWLSDSERCA